MWEGSADRRNEWSSENPFCFPGPIYHSSKSTPVFLCGTTLSHTTSFRDQFFYPGLQKWVWLSLSPSMHCIFCTIKILQGLGKKTQSEPMTCNEESKLFFLLDLNLKIRLEANDNLDILQSLRIKMKPR